MHEELNDIAQGLIDHLSSKIGNIEFKFDGCVRQKSGPIILLAQIKVCRPPLNIWDTDDGFIINIWPQYILCYGMAFHYCDPNMMNQLTLHVVQTCEKLRMRPVFVTECLESTGR